MNKACLERMCRLVTWEKDETKQREKDGRELYPAPRKSVEKTDCLKGKEEPLLWLQILLCAAIVAFVLFSKNTNASYWGSLQNQYQAVLEKGISFSSETTFSHFADQVIEKLRQKAQDVLDQLDEGALTGRGGLWKIESSKRVPPEGASLETYAVEGEFCSPVVGVLTSDYGFRDNPVDGEGDFHAGLDIAAAEGSAVECVQAGQVVRTGYNSERGNYIVVRHANGLQTLYQHMACIFVRAGETLEAAQRIGTVGSTGYSTGPHLHFELIVNGVRMDPSPNFPELFS